MRLDGSLSQQNREKVVEEFKSDPEIVVGVQDLTDEI